MDVLTVGISSAAFILSLLTGIVMCLCCRCWVKKERKNYKNLNDKEATSPAPIKVKQTTDFQTARKTSVKLKGQPDKAVESQGIQPNLYSQSGLNKQLGISEHIDGSEKSTASTKDTQPFQSILQGAFNTFDDSSSVKDEVFKEISVDHQLGRIEFSLRYDPAKEILMLKILRAVDLPAKDFNGTSDPYVKIILLPDKKSKVTTKIKRKKLNPSWNETFLFEGYPYVTLFERTLYIQVLDYDRFSRDDPIGELYLPLAGMDLLTAKILWMDLQPSEGHKGKLGELLLSLCYDPTLGKLTIVIMKARALKAKDINGYSDPYIKIWLHRHGKREEKRKTSTKEKNLNPVYNESFVFNVTYSEIRHTSLRISVMDHDTFGRNERIGELLLGSRSGTAEIKHWNEMFSKARQPVAQWHMLKIIDK